MRIGAMPIDAYNGGALCHKAAHRDLLGDELLYLIFVDVSSLNEGLGDFLPSLSDNPVKQISRFLVQFVLLLIKHARIVLQKRGGRDHFDLKTADKIDHSSIDPGNVRDCIAWRILHGDDVDTFEKIAELFFELLPS